MVEMVDVTEWCWSSVVDAVMLRVKRDMVVVNKFIWLVNVSY